MAESQIPLKFLDISWWRTQQTICRDHKVVIAHPLAVSQQSTCREQPQTLYLYCDERRDILWNIAWAQEKSRVLRLYFIILSNMSHNTDILNYNSSIDLPWRSILEELILRIAQTAWQYDKIIPSRLSNIEELNFNIIMFSNWEFLVTAQ